MMYLSRDVAQRVASRIASGLACSISVTDVNGYVLANTTHEVVGAYLTCAAEATTTGQLCRDVGGQEATLCVPLAYGAQTLGAIVLHHALADERDYQDIAHISQTLAELIIYQSIVIEQLPQQRWVRDKFIYDLLHNQPHGSPETMLQEAALFGIDLRVPRIAVLVDITSLMARATASFNGTRSSGTNHAHTEHIHEQLLDQAQRVTHADNADMYGCIGDHWLILLAAVDPANVEARHQQVLRTAQHLLDEFARSFGTVVSAGVGRYYPGWQALSESFTDACFARKTGAALYGGGRVFCAADLGLAALLWSDNRASKVALAERLLHPLRGERELCATLEMFLETNLSHAQTAQTLHIHRHTLAYRLDKITNLLGLDPRSFDGAAHLRAALLLNKLHNATTT